MTIGPCGLYIIDKRKIPVTLFKKEVTGINL